VTTHLDSCDTCRDHSATIGKLTRLCGDISDLKTELSKENDRIWDGMGTKMKTVTFTILMSVLMPILLGAGGFFAASVGDDIDDLEKKYQSDMSVMRGQNDQLIQRMDSLVMEMGNVRSDIRVFSITLSGEIERAKEADRQCMEKMEQWGKRNSR